jgi:hypothetical protein
VAGVVGDVRYQASTGSRARDYFPKPSLESPDPLAVRLAPSAGNVDRAIRAMVSTLDPDLP